MKRLTWRLLGVFVVIGLLAVTTRSAFAGCDIRDPSCYLHDAVHRQLRDFSVSVWQMNRAGLIIARWIEDLHAWMIDTVLVNAFTSLTKPVQFVFWLAVVIGWAIFVVSFMVQSLIDLRWVDLRKATRPILLAMLVFTVGGEFIRWSEDARLMGNSILQQVAQDASRLAGAPPISTPKTNDLAGDSTTSIYTASTSCGDGSVGARTIPFVALNDYAARYLWANANDIHCAALTDMAQAFRTYYFGGSNGSLWVVLDEGDGEKRSIAIAYAAQGGLRQVTGLIMTLGAIIEHLVNLLFALALGLVWFGLLLSLAFAVFLPTEALFASQLKALLEVMKASWIASFLIGLGLAILNIVAASGNGFAMLFGGLILIALCLWQGQKALETVTSAVNSTGMAMGGAPQAVGGMLKGWATTAALVGGAVATGGMGAALGQVGSTMVRRAGRSLGDNPLSEAAGRVLTNRIADKIDSRVEDARMAQEADLNTAEAAWYERDYEGKGDFAADADAAVQRDAAKTRTRQQEAALLDRKAERARKSGNFREAARLRKEADAVRNDTMVERDLDTAYTGATQALDAVPLDEDTVERAFRRSQLKAVRNRALREKRFDDAKDAIRELRDSDAVSTETTMEMAEEPIGAVTASEQPQQAEVLHASQRTIEQLNRKRSDLVPQASAYGQPSETLLADDSATVVTLSDARQPASSALIIEALSIDDGALQEKGTLTVARTDQGLVVNGYAVDATRSTPDQRLELLTTGGSAVIAAEDGERVLALPVGEAVRVAAATVIDTVPDQSVIVAPSNALTASAAAPATEQQARADEASPVSPVIRSSETTMTPQAGATPRQARPWRDGGRSQQALGATTVPLGGLSSGAPTAATPSMPAATTVPIVVANTAPTNGNLPTENVPLAASAAVPDAVVPPTVVAQQVAPMVTPVTTAQTALAGTSTVTPTPVTTSTPGPVMPVSAASQGVAVVAAPISIATPTLATVQAPILATSTSASPVAAVIPVAVPVAPAIVATSAVPTTPAAVMASVATPVVSNPVVAPTLPTVQASTVPVTPVATPVTVAAPAPLPALTPAIQPEASSSGTPYVAPVPSATTIPLSVIPATPAVVPPVQQPLPVVVPPLIAAPVATSSAVVDGIGKQFPAASAPSTAVPPSSSPVRRPWKRSTQGES